MPAEEGADVGVAEERAVPLARLAIEQEAEVQGRMAVGAPGDAEPLAGGDVDRRGGVLGDALIGQRKIELREVRIPRVRDAALADRDRRVEGDEHGVVVVAWPGPAGVAALRVD